MQHEQQQPRGQDNALPPVDVANEQQVASFLRSRIRVFPNFPRPGIDFSDVTTLLLDPAAFQLAIDALRHRYADRGVTHVVSCESRGFIFGAPLALALQVAFVPVRRARRLPGHTVGVDYTSGFYTGRMEIHDDAIQKGGRVVIIDDLVATGNTLKVTCELITQLGAEVVECGCVINSIRSHHFLHFAHIICSSSVSISLEDKKNSTSTASDGASETLQRQYSVKTTQSRRKWAKVRSVLIGVASLVCLAWTLWLVLLTARPDATINYLMGTKEYDNGSFWLIAEPGLALTIVGGSGFAAVAIGHLLNIAIQAIQTKAKLAQTALENSIVHHLLVKLVDLGFQTGLLVQLMERGLSEKLVWTLTALISLNFATCALTVWHSHVTSSGFHQMLVDVCFDVLTSVAFPMLVVSWSLAAFTFDHRAFAINLDVFPDGRLERQARLSADPTQVELITQSLRSLRILSVLDFFIRVGSNAILCFRCPCISLLDRALTPKTFAEWTTMKDVTDKVVQLASTGDLRSIQLVNRQLQEIPEVLLSCEYLKHISLYYTDTTAIPPWFKQFKNLEYFHVEGKSGAPSLTSFPEDAFQGMHQLSFIHVANHRIMLALVPSIPGLPDMARIKHLKSFIVAARSSMCCNGFRNIPCDLSDIYCAPPRLTPAVCLADNRTEPIVTEATLKFFARFASSVCAPVTDRAPQNDPVSDASMIKCEDKLFTLCQTFRGDPGMCYTAGIEPANLTYTV
ncbi:hypothetical protein PybrP1_004335 [[Pythium] brassicae (nom. inval.)]|nr:hypothetical protein PybrP1_004335 [[Pythium] brassicae (nom. inval.)]